jgi:hypothetical protein
LLRRFAPGLNLTEARSLALADDELRASPTSFVAVAVDASSAAPALLKIAHWRDEFPSVTSVVLLDQPNPDLNLALREAGAQLVIDTLFDLPLLARMAERHAASLEGAARWVDAMPSGGFRPKSR